MASLDIRIDPSSARRGAQQINRALDSISEEARETSRDALRVGASFGTASDRATAGIKGMVSSLGGLRGILTGLVAFTGIASLASAFRSGQRAATEFEDRIGDLQAITGAAGADLQFMADAAREMGAVTTFSAAQAADAFTLVASAQPQLLENASALRAVTQEALSLAEAAGLSLPDAADVLGISLNQFGLEADQAGRVINVLAAGAQFGASQIQFTAAALQNAGVTARTAGVSFEEMNAAIQVLASVGLRGGEAGTPLRNILLKLEQQSEQLRPSVVGLNQALENLDNQNLTTAQSVRIFGAENINAANALVQNREELAALEERITGTGTAYEQAAIRVNDLAGDVAALSSAWSELNIVLRDSGGTDLLRFFTQGLTTGIRNAAEGVENLANAFAGLPAGVEQVEQELERLQARRDAFTAAGVQPEPFVVSGIAELEQRLVDLREASGDLGLEEGLAGASTEADDLANSLQQVTQEVQSLSAEDFDPLSEFRALNPQQLLRRTRSLRQELRTPEEELNFQREYIALLQERGVLTEELAARALQRAQAEFAESSQAAEAGRELVDVYRDLITSLDPVQAAQLQFRDTLDDINIVAQRAQELGLSEVDVTNLRTAANQQLREELERLNTTQDAQAEATSRVVGRYLPARAAAERYRRALQDISAANLSGVESERAKASALQEYQRVLDSLEEPQRRLIEQQRRIAEEGQRQFEEFSSSVSQALASFLTGTEDALTSFLQNIAQQVLQAQLQATVVNPIVSALSGAFGGFFGGGQAITGTVAAAPTARQFGGRTSPGRNYIVGERGPELLSQGAGGGVVTPLPQAALGGGGGVQVNVNNLGAPDNVNVRSSTGPSGEQVVDITVADSLRRQSGTGELDRTMGFYGGRRGLIPAG